MQTALAFDFEPFLLNNLTSEYDTPAVDGDVNHYGRPDPKHRTMVCRHWLLALCMKGTSCEFLHRLDRSKMPVCRHGVSCKIKMCLLRHVEGGEVSECVFFKQGFCYNGPNCVRRHLKRLPDEAPKEASFELGIPTAASTAIVAPAPKKKKGPNENFKMSLCNHWLMNGNCPFSDDCHFAHGEQELQDGYQADASIESEVFDPTKGRLDAELVLPFSESAQVAYFLFQAPDLRSLAVSKRRGVWSVPTIFAAEINASFSAYDHVIVYFCVRALRGIYGVAQITGPVPSSPPTAPHLNMSPEFPISWIRTLRVPLRTVAQLKVTTTGIFVGRTLTDAKFDKKVGSEIMYICYRKPAWDWSADEQLPQAEAALMRDAAATAALASLPPDTLFGADWVEKAVNPFGGGSGGAGLGQRGPGGAAGPGHSVFVPNIPQFGPRIGGVAAHSPPMLQQQDFYTLEFPGFVFNASGLIIEEIFGRSIFGLPPHMKDVSIDVGAPLFLFDAGAQLLLGLFQASSTLVDNLQPGAFVDWMAGGQCVLPRQVRFSIVLDCAPVPLMDPELQAVFSPASAGGAAIVGSPLGGPLGLRETKALANLFARRAGMATFSGGEQDNSSKAVIDANGMYKPPYKFVEVVPIDVVRSVYEMKRKLLGTNGSMILQIVSEVGGPQRLVRIRIRGTGSGFLEGPPHMQKELEQPLHFNVSAETEEMLVAAVEKVKSLIVRAKDELLGCTAAPR